MLKGRFQDKKSCSGIFRLSHLLSCDSSADKASKCISSGYTADHLKISLKITHSSFFNGYFFVVQIQSDLSYPYILFFHKINLLRHGRVGEAKELFIFKHLHSQSAAGVFFEYLYMFSGSNSCSHSVLLWFKVYFYQ